MAMIIERRKGRRKKSLGRGGEKKRKILLGALLFTAGIILDFLAGCLLLKSSCRKKTFAMTSRKGGTKCIGTTKTNG